MHDDSPSNTCQHLPVMLSVVRRRCVVVGGGAVAARRAVSLAACGAEVIIIAPRLNGRLDHLPAQRVQRAYEAGDLDGAFLVVIATDNPAVNQQVADDADRAGVLVNRADDASATGVDSAPHSGPNSGAGDFTVMAHGRRGPLTLAVDTANTSAAAAKMIRDELLDALDDDWITLLTESRPWRAKIRCSSPSDKAGLAEQPGHPTATRINRLRRLTDDTAMKTLKQKGLAALRSHLQAVAEGWADSTP